MSETHPTARVNEEGKKAGKLDLNALADAFAAQGNVVEANKFRDLARRQPELEKKTRAEKEAYWNKLQQEGDKEPIPTPLEPHERADAVQIPREEFLNKIRDQIKMEIKNRHLPTK